jgi:fibronectin-binding autotransporter adhesin
VNLRGSPGIWEAIALKSGQGRRAGFAIGPILYLLGLIGVAAGVLFSSYSQILRSNQQVTNNLASKNDLQAIATTLAATSVLGSSDNTVLCPPTGGGASANCGSAAIKLTAFSGQAQLPVGTASLASTGAPSETGVFVAGSGLKQLDPWGHYYVICRWENHTAPGSDPAFMVISAGLDGTLQTKCGDTAAKGDDIAIWMPVSTAIERSAVWETSPVTIGSQTVTQAQFGEPGSKVTVDALGDLTVPGTLAVGGISNFGNTIIAATFQGPLTGNVAGDVTGTGASSFGSIGVGSSHQLTVDTSGNFLTTGTLEASNTTVNGTFTAIGSSTLGASTIDSASITNAATVGGTLGVTGATTLTGVLTTSVAVNVGTTVAIGSTALLSVGKSTAPNIYPFMVYPTGDVVANGTISGGSVSGGSGAFGSISATSWTGDLTGSGNATFASDTVTANSFVGTFTGNVTGNSTNVTGVVTYAHGGTNYAASGASDLLDNLFNSDTAPTKTINVNRLAADSIPGGDLQSGSVTSTQLDTESGITAGATYTSVTVDSAGRVIAGSNSASGTNQLSDSSSDSLTIGTTGLAITFSGSTKDAFNTSGWLGLGTSSPTQMLDVYGGNILIEGVKNTNRQLEYATTTSGSPSLRWSVMTNSDNETGSGDAGSDFVIQNYSDSGTAISGTPALTLVRASGNALFEGQLTAPSYTATGTPGFIGDGSGLTNIPASSITGSLTTTITLGTSTAATNPQRSADATTGLFSPAAGTVSVASAGNEILRVNGTGVGIDVTTIANALDVSGGAAIGSYAGNNAAGSGNLIVSGVVGIGTASPVSSTALDIYSTTQGVLPPLVNDAQEAAIASPVKGLVVYNTQTNELESYNGTTWEAVGANADDAAGSDTQIQFNKNGVLGADSDFNWDYTDHRLGIGTAAPQSEFEVYGGEAQVGSSGVGCTSANAGAIRYASGTLSFCNGTIWTASSAGGGSATVNIGTQYEMAYYAADGSVLSGDVHVTTDASNNFIINAGKLAIGANFTPTYDLSFDGTSSREEWVERATSGAGNNLRIAAGGAQSGATDTAGGSLILSSGISTGTGWSNIQLQTYPTAGSTSSSDNTPVTALEVYASGSASSGQGALATTIKATDGSGTDENGGTLNVASGTSTGTGSSGINFNVYGAAGGSSSTANSATTAMTILGNGNVGIGQTAPTANLQLGNHTSTSTSTPVTIDMGATWSDTPGQNPKLILFDNGGFAAGLGISEGEMDSMMPPGTSYAWYFGGNVLMYLHGSAGLDVRSQADPYAATLYTSYGSTEETYLRSGNYGGVHIGDGSTSTVLLMENGGGNVGIGTTSPAAELDVAGNIDVESNAVTTQVANSSSTGTSLNQLAKLTGAPSTAVIAATSDTGGMIGIVVAGAGTIGNAQIAVSGQASCVFDGATTAGHYVGISSTTAGDCHDAGSSYPTSGQVLGRVLSTNGSGGTYPVVLYGPEIKAASGGAGNPAGSDTQVQFNQSGSFGADSNFSWDYTTHQLGIGTSSPAASLDDEGTLLVNATNTDASTSGSETDVNLVNVNYVPSSTSTVTMNGVANYLVAEGSADLSEATLTGVKNVALLSNSNPAPVFWLNGAQDIAATVSPVTWMYGSLSQDVNYSAGGTGGVLFTVGSQSNIFNQGDGGIGFATAVQANVTNYDSAGAIGSAAGVGVAIDEQYGSDIGEGYGVYIAEIQADNKWGLYQTDSTANNYFAGAVGIGTEWPESMLQVYNGEAQVGSSGAPCTVTIAGAIRYASGLLYYCNGSAWTLSSAGGGSGAVSSGTQYQIGYYASSGSIISGDSAITTDASNNFIINAGKLAIGANFTPTYDLSFDGTTSREEWVERAASGAGNNLTIAAGGAQSGVTDTAGGSLILSSGISTGTGFSNIQLQTYPAAGSTSTIDNTAVTALKVYASGSASSGQGTLATTIKATDGSGTDENGGTLNVSSGTSTGTGSSGINLKVYGAAGSTSSTANSSTTAMTILGNGNVGIGTTAPSGPLHVNFTNTATSGATVGVAITPTYNQAYNPSGASVSTDLLVNRTETSLANPGPIYQNLLDLQVNGNSKFSVEDSGYVQVGGSISVIGQDAVYDYDTSAYSASGTSAPYPGFGGGYFVAVNNAGGSAAFTGDEFQVNNSSNVQVAYIGVVSNSGSTVYTPSIVIGQETGSSSYAERMRIDENGNVGIGQTSPAAMLDVGGNIDTEHYSQVREIENEGTTGTTANKLGKLTGAPSRAIIASTSDTGGMVGIVVGGAGTIGNAQIAVSGQASCVFDGATTAGHYVGISSTTAGDCHDAGSTYPGSGQVLGRVLSTNGSGGTYAVILYGPEIKAASGGAGDPAGFDTQVQFNQSGSFGADGNYNWDYTNHRLGIDTASPTHELSFGSGAGREVLVERATSGAGNTLTIAAGGAQSGTADLAGGSLILSSGMSTGTGFSNIQLQTYPAAGSTSSSDNTPVTALEVYASGSASSGKGALATTIKATDGSGTDENGGTLNVTSGTSTGTGSSGINFNVYGAAGGSSSTANSATTAMTILGNGNVGIATTVPPADLQIGNDAQVATATPTTIDMGGTYSNAEGANPKLMLYNDGTYVFGFGVSNESLDSISFNSFNWYQNW